MKLFLAVLVSFWVSTVPASGLKRVAGPLPSDSDASAHYEGQLTISGEYREDEAGDLCFKPDHQSQKRLVAVPAGAQLCFSNEERAAKLLHVRRALEEIDTRHVCGIVGTATVVVSGLWVGEGPAARWYTTSLVQVVKRAPPRLIGCGA